MTTTNRIEAEQNEAGQDGAERNGDAPDEARERRIAELEEERRWIPVSEPPKKSDWYLKMYDGYRIPDEDYYDIETGWVSGNIPDFWMPLPEPPEVK